MYWKPKSWQSNQQPNCVDQRSACHLNPQLRAAWQLTKDCDWRLHQQPSLEPLLDARQHYCHLCIQALVIQKPGCYSTSLGKDGWDSESSPFNVCWPFLIQIYLFINSDTVFTATKVLRSRSTVLSEGQVNDYHTHILRIRNAFKHMKIQVSSFLVKFSYKH